MNIETLENEIQSWIAVKSFAVEDAHPQLPIIDANELAEMLSSVFKKLEGCVVVPKDQAKDTARLDFLLADTPTRTICQHTHWSDDGELIAEGQCVAEIYYISGWDYIRESISETKRQAIDKAMLEAARGGNE